MPTTTAPRSRVTAGSVINISPKPLDRHARLRSSFSWARAGAPIEKSLAGRNPRELANARADVRASLRDSLIFRDRCDAISSLCIVVQYASAVKVAGNNGRFPLRSILRVLGNLPRRSCVLQTYNAAAINLALFAC